MRSRALTVLSKILVKQLDPRYRKTAVDVLRLLDQADAIQGSKAKRGRSASGGPQTKVEPQVDIDQIINEIDQIVAEQRLSQAEPPRMPVLDSRPVDPPKVANEVTPVKEEPVSQATTPPASGFQLVRKPGHFGKGAWMRVPSEY
jgi:hypothetical protein